MPSNFKNYKYLVFVLCSVLSLFSVPLDAQTVSGDPMAVTPADTTSAIAAPATNGTVITLESLQAQRKVIADSENRDAETKVKLLDIYDKAIAQFKVLEEGRARRTSFIQQRQAAPADLEKLTAQLAEPPVEITVDPKMTTAELDPVLTAAKAALQDAQNRAAAFEKEPKRRIDRKAAIPEEINSAKEQLLQIEAKIAAAAAVPAETAPSDSAAANRILLKTQLMTGQNNIAVLEEEARCYDATAQLLAAQRDMATRTLTAAQKRTAALDARLTELRTIEAEQAKARAKQDVRQTQDLHPVLKDIAQENARLAQLQSEVLKKVNDSAEYSKNLEASYTRFQNEFAEIQKRVTSAGEITNVMGVRLVGIRKELPDLRSNRDRIKLRLGKISSAQIEWNLHDSQWSALSNVDESATDILTKASLSPENVDYPAVLSEAVRLLTDRRKTLQTLAQYYLDYSDTLSKMDVRERSYVRMINDYAHFIDSNILWVRSIAPMRTEDFRGVLSAIRWLVRPGNWGGLAASVAGDVKRTPLVYAIFIIAVVGVYVYRPRIRSATDRLADHIAHRYTDSFGHTVKVVLLTLLHIIPVPAIAFFLSWRLLNLPAPVDDFTSSLASALYPGVFTITILVLLIACSAPTGIGLHLGLDGESLKALRRNLLWFAWPFAAVAILCDMLHVQQTNEAWFAGLGRILFLSQQILLAVLLLIIMHPSGAILTPVLTLKKTGWLNRLRYFWYFLVLVVPAALCLLAVTGYFYAAQHLYGRFLQTILFIVAVIFLRAMFARWIKVVHQHLLIREDRKRVAAARGASTASSGEFSVTGESRPDLEGILGLVTRQAERLVRAVTFVLLFLGVWWIWRSVLPALGALENMRCWDTTDAQGATVVISLGSVIAAAVIFVVMVVLARNVPGFLDVLILRRLPVDQGIAFAVTSLTRYIIVVVGVVLTFSRIGVGWSKVQWLIAAMTVGLGFGLQEIFANFVSGLIILFEQPIRVGDVVTVGDINGKVTRIRIRATTIRKWDHKELIVPNREFITGRLINWTLSDKTLRMDFHVGVAYGSDIAKTEQTLYRIARDRTDILQNDPPPVVIFRGFGDSSLDFELRVCIPNMDHYLETWHGINCAIDTEFRKENIEIAFPQRDVHIRSISTNFPVDAKPPSTS